MKKRMIEKMKRRFCILQAIVLLGSGMVDRVYAQPVVQDEIVEEMMDADEFEKVQTSLRGAEKIGNWENVIDLEDPSQIPNYGYIEIEKEREVESIYDLPMDKMEVMEAEVVELPEKYVNEKLPDTRNQGVFGTCWAHASLAAAEANLMKTGIVGPGKLDTSELHLAYFAYHTTTDPLGGISQDTREIGPAGDNYLMQGGNTLQATRTLFAWLGAADENIAPYSNAGAAMDSGLDHGIAFEDLAHIKNAYLINPVEEREEAKRLIYEYGAITVSYLAAQNGDVFSYQGETYEFTDFYNADHNAYYCPVSTITNHAVVIVGWDDNFSKENFAIPPKGDGAWLIRNSWTASNAQSHNGYFWMSYYDKSMSHDSYAYEMDREDNYDNNYQYDGSYFSTSSYLDTCANVFEVKVGEQGESLEAIAFETDHTNLEYVVEIYIEVDEKGDPSSGKLAAIRKGNTKYAGYHTVELEHPVTLNNGERFAVVVKLIKEEYLIGINYESAINAGGYSSIPHINEGESFYYQNGQWKDQYFGEGQSGNFCIKAFTKNLENRVQANDILLPGIGLAGITIGVEEKYPVLAMALPVNAEDRTIRYQSSDRNVVAVTENGSLTGIGKGNAIITVSTENGISKSFKVTVIEKVNSLSISGEERIYVGKTYNYDAIWEPEYIIPDGSVEWSSDDPSVIRIDQNTGSVVAVGVGTTYIRAELDGLGDVIKVEVRADSYSSDFKITVGQDSGVTFTWKAVNGAESYEILSNGTLLAAFENDGRESYSYTDTTYQGIGEVQEIEYTFSVRDSIGSMSRYYDILVGPAKRVSYVIARGVNSEGNPSYYTPGEIIYLDDPIADTGYYFSGWYADEEYMEYVWSINDFDTEDLIFYAKMDPINYYVTYHSNDTENATHTISAVYDEDIILTKDKFVREEYELVGWNTKADGTGRNFGASQVVKNLTTKQYDSVTLYAQWKAKEYEVTFQAGEGRIVEGSNVKTVCAGRAYGELPIAVREGYRFTGWFLNHNGEETQVTPETIVLLKQNHELTARWEEIIITPCREPAVSIDGEIVEGIISQSEWVVVSPGARVVLEGEEKDSIYYAFVDEEGELLGEYQKYTESIPVTSRMKISVYADRPWEEGYIPSESKVYGFQPHQEIIPVKITYVISHGRNAKENVTEYLPGENIVLKEAVADTGYQFKGWYWDEEYQKPAEGVTGTDIQEITFYARIEPITYRIRYCSNEEEAETVSMNAQYGQTLEIAGELFQREGYLFADWNTKADGTGMSYQAGQTVSNLTVTEGENIYLYAQWIKSPEEAKGFRVEGLEKEYTYTGSGIKPEFKVYDGTRELTEKKDYKVIYKNNKNAGKATVVIRGCGNYKGELVKGFEIRPIDITGKEFSVDNVVVAYNKKIQKPVPTLYRFAKIISAKKNYQVEYYKAIESDGSYIKIGESLTNVKEPGHYKIWLIGKGNYTGQREVDFYINDKETTSVSKLKVTKIGVQNYSADAICPKPEVWDRKVLLTEDVHYTLTYHNNVEIGMASVTIQGIEENGYSGTKRLNYRIKGYSLRKNLIRNFSGVYEYTGRKIEPFGATDNDRDFGWAYLEDVQTKGEDAVRLVKGLDYKIVKYSNNQKAGTASVVLRGINAYSGTVTVRFKIQPVKAIDKEVKMEYDTVAAYAKGGVKPIVSSVTAELKDVEGILYVETLTEGKDYVLSYVNNKAVTTTKTKKYPTIILKGKGNYSGILARGTFKIVPRDVSSMEIVAKDRVYNGKANNYKTSLIITDLITGKKLDGKDYDTKLKYYYEEDTVVEIGHKKETVTTVRLKNTEVQEEDIIPAGTILRVETFGKNYYQGKVVAKYRIVSGDFTKAKVKIKDKEYTGQAVNITKKDVLSIVVNGQELQESEYRIVRCYNNVNKGKATVVLEGLGNYGGRKNVTFQIGKKTMFFDLF